VRGISTEKMDRIAMVVTGKVLDVVMLSAKLREKLLVISLLCASTLPS
jgi:hypothetical protein